MSETNDATNDAAKPLIPTWFWVVGVIALLWNLMGFMAVLMDLTMSAEARAELPEAQQELYKVIPVWAKICSVVAVLGGVAGSVLMLFRNRLSVPAFILSLVGVLGQNLYMFFLSDTAKVMGAAMVLPVLVMLIAIVLVAYARYCTGKGMLT